MKAYYQLFAEIPDTDYESAVAWLEKELEYDLTTAYQKKFEDSDVRHFNDSARRLYTIFFDCTQDDNPDFYSRSAKVVFVYGRSAPGTALRDHKRMRQFLGSFKDYPEYTGYDKGHFIAHCNDGQIDQNAQYLVPVNADSPEIDVQFIAKSDPYISPIGARGIGEIGLPVWLRPLQTRFTMQRGNA